MRIDTNGFETRVDMFIPTVMTGQVARGTDVTGALMATRILSGYDEAGVQAIAIGGGPKRTKVAFLWADAADCEWWYIAHKVSGGMNADAAADRFFEVAKNLA